MQAPLENLPAFKQSRAALAKMSPEARQVAANLLASRLRKMQAAKETQKAIAKAKR